MKKKMSKRAAIAGLAKHGDSILKASYANQIAQAFGFDVWKLKLVYKIEETGVDWGARAEMWDTGEAVNASTLAYVLCDELKVPLVKYCTDYGGSGRRSRAIVAQSVLSIDLHFKLRKHDCCDLCGTYDLHGTALCWGCERTLRDDYEANIHEVTGFPADTPWWVKQLGEGNYKTFATRKEAREFADLMRRAQSELRLIHGDDVA